MADMTATGWDPAGAVVVLDSQRLMGTRTGRRALVQMNMRASWFGTGAVRYPSAGVPCPSPSTVGFRGNISYIIPLGPFTAAAGCGPSVASASGGAQGNLGAKTIPWGVVPPSTGTGDPVLRFLAGPPLTTAGAGANSTLITGCFTQEFTTDMAVTTFLTTGAAGTLTAYAIFVEGGRL